MAAPVANPLNLNAVEDNLLPIALDASDLDLDPLSYEIVDAPTSGIVFPTEGGNPEDFTYVPDTGFLGVDSFTYRAFDGTSYSDTVTVTITVAAEDQSLFGTGANEVIFGASGNDTIDGLTGNDTLHGNAGNDLLLGGGWFDVLYGGDGHDTLNGGADADTMIGGTGDDTYIVNSVYDTIVESAGEGIDTVYASASYTLSENVEDLVLQGMYAVYGAGNAQSNVIYGTYGDNLLEGYAGADTLFGGHGNDVLDGGADMDVLIGGHGDDVYYVDAGDFVIEDFAGGLDMISADLSWKLPLYVEDLVLTGTADHSGWGNYLDNGIYGNSGNNKLFGFDGNDLLAGGAGNDTLNGGYGADYMIGGEGNDLYIVDDWFDTIAENPGEGIDTVHAITDYMLDYDVENLVFFGEASYMGYGNDSANKITGSFLADTLQGYGGKDTIAGGDGGDYLIGDSGSDLLFGGNGFDYLDGGAGFDVLFGGNGDDSLYGGNGNDTLNGGANNDYLNGGNGHDVMIGGVGADNFYFSTPLSEANNVDSMDFETGIDVLVLEDYIFTSLTPGGFINTSQFIWGTAAVDSDDYLIFDDTTGSLYYDADGNGAGSQVKFAQLTGSYSISDFDIYVNGLPA